MEIPEISMISDFEAGMKCLHNPSIIPPTFSLLGVGKLCQVYSFWKWGAVIFIAFIASFSGVINRIKLLIIRVRNLGSLASSSSDLLLQHFIDDYDFTDDDDDDDTYSSVSSEDEDVESTASFEDQNTESSMDEDFRVAGSSNYDQFQWQNGYSNLRRRFCGGDRFSWSDFTARKSVVKLWDGLGLSFNFKDSSGTVISLWDLNSDQKISDFFGGQSQIRQVTVPSPTELLSAEVNGNDNFMLRAFDRRITDQNPAIQAEWRATPSSGKVFRINSGGVDKVYVRDGVSGSLTVGDLRNVKSPLETLTEFDGDTLWDADAVIVDDSSF